MRKYIIWPKGQSSIENLKGFNNLRGKQSFPNVFGCVDGTHILISGKNDNSYYNRKDTYSILLQAVCDYKQRMINVTCGWPGSYHDARVWKFSKIYEKLTQEKDEWLPPNTYLLGDSAYPLDTLIMVPFRDNGHLSRSQKLFNQRLSSTRNVIENTYDRLKLLFKRLKFLNIIELNYSKYYIISTCILHNLSLEDVVDWEYEINKNLNICDDEAESFSNYNENINFEAQHFTTIRNTE